MKTKLLSILALLLVAVSGAWAEDTYTVTFTAKNGKTKTVENVTLPRTFSCVTPAGTGELDLIIQELYELDEGFCEYFDQITNYASVTCGSDGDNPTITISAPFDGTARVAGSYYDPGIGSTFNCFLDITCSQPAPVTGYTASFTAANAYTIKGGKASVSVDGGIATLDEEGKLPDINEGLKVTITAKPGYKFRKVAAEKEAAPEPEVEFVTFTDGTNTVTVATMNLGATSVADGTSCYGDYYAWGATETFGTVAYTAYNAGTVTPTTGHDGGYSQDNAPYWDKDASAYAKYTSASDATLEAADDAVAVNMPGWHMPTQAELQTLYAACGGTGEAMTPSSISDGDAYAKGIYWVAGATSSVTIGGDEYKANGVLFVQDADTHVFFPATGNANGTDLYSAGSYGNYWYSSLRTEYISNAYRLNFRSNRVDSGNFSYRYLGFPVRPFKD